MAKLPQGLFGGMGTPEEMQQQLTEQRAMKFATMSPRQQTSYNIYKNTGNLGRGLASAMGVDVQDPLVRQATTLRQMASQFNTGTSAGMREYAQAISSIDPETANRAMMMADEMELTQAKIGSEQATAASKLAEKLTGEQKNAAGIADQEANRGTPEWNTAYKRELNRLTAKAEGKINYGAETERISKAQFNKPYSELTQEQAAKVDKIVEQRDLSSSAAKASKPVDVASIIKEIGTKEDIKGKSEAWKNAGDAYKTQVPMIEKLKEVRNNLPATFTGAFSETALQFGKALSAFGVPVDENKLSNTEYMNSVSSQVLQTIARNFPGSLAVKEMDQLVKSKFSSPQQIKTISRILSDLQTEIEAGTKSYEQLAKLPETERYSKDLNLLTGQNFTKLKRYRALEDKGRAAMKSGQPMSKAEVEEAKKLQQELGA